ncbi:MAG: hypothetical protein JNK82_04340 [Myxococcaceae bacterium]|nr:hypothetical protein [Myxococcaceae bacterium]
MNRALAAMVVLGAAGAMAAPMPARLVYDVSGTPCPGKDALVSAVSARLGMNPFDNSAPQSLMVQVSAAAKGFTASVVRTRPDGTGAGKRELKSEQTDCAELFGLIELEVTLAIDPLAKVTAAPAPAAASEPQPSAPLKFDVGDGPSDTPVGRMTRSALVAEKQRLEANGPNTGAPFIAVGAGAIAAGVILTVLSVTTQDRSNIFGTSNSVFTGIGVGVAVAGLGAVAFGIFKRMLNVERIELFGMRVNEIDTQLAALQSSGAVEPGPPVPQPPPTQRAPALR